MNYQGTVRGGVIVLAPGTQLPEGITVIVHPQEPVRNDLPAAYALRNGVPVFPKGESLTPVTVELVNQLRDELS